MKEVTIKELAVQLQRKIDTHMKCFMDNYNKVKSITLEIEELEKNMVTVVRELEPVESLIYNQNPELERIFESLKRIYTKEENGIDRETH